MLQFFSHCFRCPPELFVLEETQKVNFWNWYIICIMYYIAFHARVSSLKPVIEGSIPQLENIFNVFLSKLAIL